MPQQSHKADNECLTGHKGNNECLNKANIKATTQPNKAYHSPLPLERGWG